jgi:hypothetical protein
MRAQLGLLALVLATYTLAYVGLSYRGDYVPAKLASGLYGVQGESYVWAPVGYYSRDSGLWIHKSMRRFFAPLSFVDHRLWHRRCKYLPGFMNCTGSQIAD